MPFRDLVSAAARFSKDPETFRRSVYYAWNVLYEENLRSYEEYSSAIISFDIL